MDMEQLVKNCLVNEQTLNLENKNVGDAGAKTLAGMEILSKLTTLELGDNGIGDEGIKALAD